jgi:hypothetical protein
MSGPSIVWRKRGRSLAVRSEEGGDSRKMFLINCFHVEKIHLLRERDNEWKSRRAKEKSKGFMKAKRG